MNVMAQAHKMTREAMANVDKSVCVITYKQAFSVYLRAAHQEYKKMTEQSKALAAQSILDFEQRIVELKAILETPVAAKYMVVCGDDHPMPINFESKQMWSNVETATKWASPQFARVNAQKVVNGNKQVGKAVQVSDHIEWDILNLEKLIKDLKAL